MNKIVNSSFLNKTNIFSRKQVKLPINLLQKNYAKTNYMMN